MLPNGLDAVCAERPLLLAFLEVIDAALDPATGLPVRSRIDIVRLGRKGVLPNVWMIERGTVQGGLKMISKIFEFNSGVGREGRPTMATLRSATALSSTASQ